MASPTSSSSHATTGDGDSSVVAHSTFSRKSQLSSMKPTMNNGNSKLKEFFVAQIWYDSSYLLRYRSDTSLLSIATAELKTLVTLHGKNKMSFCVRGCFPHFFILFSLLLCSASSFVESLGRNPCVLSYANKVSISSTQIRTLLSLQRYSNHI